MENVQKSICREPTNKPAYAIRGIFQDRMEAPINRLILLKSLVQTADLMDVFGDRTEWYLTKLQSGLYDILTDVVDGYHEAMGETEEMSNPMPPEGENQEIGAGVA